MSRHVVVGKGPIGRTLAHLLADQGHEVLVLSRSGGLPGNLSDTPPRGVVADTVDATDAAELTAAADGADALHNCVNPPYHRWATRWPPIADALLTAAERTGAVLVTAGNLYGYGRGTTTMTEGSPLASTETKGRVRAEMWDQARRRHEAGDLRATEIRGSDYLGPGAEAHAHAGPRMLAPMLAGRTLRPLGSADQPHTWTYLPDFAAAMAAAACTASAWGSAWHVPSPEPLSYRQLATRFARAAGAPEPRISPLPIPVVRLLGAVAPMLREIAAVGYQFTEPFVMESAVSAATLGVTATDWDTIVAETLAEHRHKNPAR